MISVIRNDFIFLKYDVFCFKLWYLENHSNSESVHMNLDLYEMKDLAQASSPTRPQPDHVSRSWICDIKFSSDGSRLVFCSDVIQWWTTSNVRLLQKFPIRGSKVTSIYCSPDFRSLVTIDDTGVLYYLKQINCDKKSSYRKDIIF